jgi:hypothetical protein
MLQLFYGHECLYSMKNLKEGTRLDDINRDGKLLILIWTKIHRAGGFGLDKSWPIVNKIINFVLLEMREIR